MGSDKFKRSFSVRWCAIISGCNIVLSTLLLLLQSNNVDCQLVRLNPFGNFLEQDSIDSQRANYYDFELNKLPKQEDYYFPQQNQQQQTLDLMAAQLLAKTNGGASDRHHELENGNNDLAVDKYLVQDRTPRDELSVKSFESKDRINRLMWQLFSDEQQMKQFRDALMERQQQSESSKNPIVVVDDINLHLPADNPLGGGGLVSQPANDPAEFEASMSHLTNKLNHELPNSQNRTQWLSNYLVNYYLAELNDNNNSNDDAKTKSTDGQVLDGLILQYLAARGGGDLDIEASKTKGDFDESSTDDDDDQLPTTISTAAADSSRYGSGSEYIDHPLALAGHQYVQGGAGEGRQLLGPEGTFENVQVIKSDHAVPAYCDPPNPCPIGFTAEDGCLERFINSASFSREYQAKQQCSCDNEHSLFNCATGPPPSSSPSKNSKHVELSEKTKSSSSSSGDTDGDGESDDGGNQITTIAGARLDTLARTIQNRFGDLATIRNLVSKHENEASTPAESSSSSSSYLVRSTRKWQPLD